MRRSILIFMRVYKMALLSGVLLALSFYPFGFSLLALVALAPLYFFIVEPARTGREAFWGGFFAGVVCCVFFYAVTLAQLEAGLGAAYYTWFIRFLSIPGALLESALFGLMAWGWWRLRAAPAPRSLLAAAALYVLLEYCMHALFGGYYPNALSMALVDLPGALRLAALAGAPAVSFGAALMGVSLGYACLYTSRAGWSFVVGTLAVLALLAALPFGYRVEHRGLLEVAVIQTVPQERYQLMEGVFEGGQFSNPLLRVELQQALPSALVVYPYTPAGAPLKEPQETAVGVWLNTFMPTTTTVVFWGNAAREGKLYTQFMWWQGGQEQRYQKQKLYALSDYTPWWARLIGVEKSPEAVSVGVEHSAAAVQDLRAGSSICSELHQSGYVRSVASESDFVVAGGFDGFFPGRVMGEYSFAVARYRAAENGTPLVRANLFGPSALIAADGSVVGELSWGERGVLRGTLSVEKIVTPYTRFGPWPLYGLLILSLGVAWYAARSRGSAGSRSRG